MTAKEQELLQRLLATFKIEAQDHVSAFLSGLEALRKSPSPDNEVAIIEAMFREAHSLKGAARTVNQEKIETICQSMENMFASLKSGETAISADLFDRLYRCVDTLSTLLSEVTESRSDLERDSRVQTIDAAAAKPGGSSETLRVSTSKLDSLFRQTEELIPARALASQRAFDCREIEQILAQCEKEWRAVRPFARTLQSSRVPGHQGSALAPRGARFQSFLDLNERALETAKNKLAVLRKQLNNDRRFLERRVDELVEEVKAVSMVPFSSVLESFPRIVRDLCRNCGKDAELVLTGGELEADRRVLEEMKDPLIHLIRNSIDHGIEPPPVRQERGKPSRATISIAIAPRNGNWAEIVVSDDGSGIDFQKIGATALKLGRVSSEELRRMDAQRALAFIFESGVSTSPMITQVSGRGLGLAIVREKAEKVGGSVAVETKLGRGTSFCLRLPLTLAGFRGLVVRVGENDFALPMLHVQKALRLGRDEIKTVENRETIQLDDRAVSAVRLADVLKIAQRPTIADPKGKLPALVLGWAGEQVAFLVDEILEEREFVVKGLGRQLLSVPNVAGATILGTGKVLPVLNVADLIRSAVTISPAAIQEAREVPKSVLVAEDSITSRTLLKSILESDGYKVTTAVDGAEALRLLAHEQFNLVVSDVDMPRMNGFDLTARIRNDKDLSHLPVVLVTTLDSRDDRERGIDVGANAYIVKGSFDQGTLLDVVRRLV